MRARFPIATRTCYHVVSPEITQRDGTQARLLPRVPFECHSHRLLKAAGLSAQTQPLARPRFLIIGLLRATDCWGLFASHTAQAREFREFPGTHGKDRATAVAICEGEPGVGTRELLELNCQTFKGCFEL